MPHGARVIGSYTGQGQPWQGWRIARTLRLGAIVSDGVRARSDSFRLVVPSAKLEEALPGRFRKVVLLCVPLEDSSCFRKRGTQYHPQLGRYILLGVHILPDVESFPDLLADNFFESVESGRDMFLGRAI